MLDLKENLSDLVGAATGVGPGANTAQIKRIAKLLTQTTISEKIQEKLVRRLQKPRMYGLFCVYKTLYLLIHLLPISHDAFRQYWIRNCGLFDVEYLNDASDSEEVEVCQLINKLLIKIKGTLLKTLDIGCNLQDTMPPEYTTSIGRAKYVSVSAGRTDNAEGSSQKSPSASSNITPKGISEKITTISSHASNTSPPFPNDPKPEFDNKNNYTPMTPVSPNSNPALFIPECFRNPGLPKTAVFSLQALKTNHSMSQRVSVDGSTILPTPSHSAPSIHQTLDRPSGSTMGTSSQPLFVRNPTLIQGSAIVRKTSNPRLPINVGMGSEKVAMEAKCDIFESQSQPSKDDDDVSQISVVLTEYTHQAESSDMDHLYSELVWDLTRCIQKDAIPFAGGGNGNVWKGIYTRSIDGRVIKQDTVAIKINHSRTHHSQDESMKKLYHEVHIWQKLRHKNIVPFYGIYNSQQGSGMVSPFYSHGHVIQYLKTSKMNPIKFILEIAKGVQYLHLNGIIHGDLKGTNILVHNDGYPCLTDFGLAQIHNDQMIALGHLVFTRETSLPWSPPELLRPASTKVFKTEKSDIYSFACTIVEMMTLKPPYPHITDISTLIRKICEAEYLDRPKHPWSLPDELWMLVKRCWNGRAEERPTIHQIIKELGNETS